MKEFEYISVRPLIERIEEAILIIPTEKANEEVILEIANAEGIHSLIVGEIVFDVRNHLPKLDSKIEETDKLRENQAGNKKSSKTM